MGGRHANIRGRVPRKTLSQVSTHMDDDRIKILEEELVKSRNREIELPHRCDLLTNELAQARSGIETAIEELRK